MDANLQTTTFPLGTGPANERLLVFQIQNQGVAMRRRDIRAERKASESARWAGFGPLEQAQDWREERDQERTEYPEYDDDYEQRQMLQ